jgi:hypothetical protein
MKEVNIMGTGLKIFLMWLVFGLVVFGLVVGYFYFKFRFLG